MYIEISNFCTRGLSRVWKTWKIWKMSCFLEKLRENLYNSGNLNWNSFGSRKSQGNFRNVLSARLLNSFLRFSFQFCNRLRFLRLHPRTFQLPVFSIFSFSLLQIWKGWRKSFLCLFLLLLYAGTCDQYRTISPTKNISPLSQCPCPPKLAGW